MGVITIYQRLSGTNWVIEGTNAFVSVIKEIGF